MIERRFATFLSVLVFLELQMVALAQGGKVYAPGALEPGKRHALSLSREEVERVGAGALATFRVPIEKDAHVVVWARSEGCDTKLAVRIDGSPSVKPVTIEDRSSAGGQNPCVEREAIAGERWTVSWLRESDEITAVQGEIYLWISTWSPEARQTEAALTPDDPRLQTARTNFAIAIAELGELARARELLEQVLAIQERTLPPESLSLQIARLNLATIIYQLGEYDRSIRLWCGQRRPDDRLIGRLSVRQDELRLANRKDLSGARDWRMDALYGSFPTDAFTPPGDRLLRHGRRLRHPKD